MSLTRQHKEFVDSAISYLFDFPHDFHELKIEVEKIRQALFFSISSDHDYYLLQQALLHPEQTLRRLEDCAKEPITVADVKLYLIDLLSTSLKDASEKASVSLQELGWNEATIKQLLIADKDEKFFKTENLKPSVSNSQHSSSIFTCSGRVRLDYKKNIAYLVVCFDLPWLPYNHKVTQKIANIPYDETLYEDEFINQLLPVSNKMLAEIVAHVTYKEFIARYPDLNLIVSYAKLNQHINSLFMLRFYVDALLSKKIHLFDLLTLKPKQVEVLRSDLTQKLLKADLCTFNEACELKPYDLKIIQIYSALIFSKKLSLSEISSLSENQASLFMLPTISHLILQDKLSFPFVKYLPNCVKALFTSPLYMDYLLTGNLDWSSLYDYTDVTCQYLLEPAVANVIKERKFGFSDALILAKEIKPKYSSIFFFGNRQAQTHETKALRLSSPF